MKKFCAIFLTVLLLLTSACGYTQDDLEEARQAGYDEGHAAAELEFYDSRYEEGYAVGYDNGYDDGRSDADLASSDTRSYSSESPTTSSEQSEAMVYVSRTGTKYHSDPNCSNMKNPSYVSFSDAVAQGRTSCSKCN